MLAKRTKQPRAWASPWARFRLAYNLYGGLILLTVLCIVFLGGFLTWAVVNVRRPAPPASVSAPRGFVQNDGTVFQAEILYAAAHRYAGDHDGRLPSANNCRSRYALILLAPGPRPRLTRFQPWTARAAL